MGVDLEKGTGVRVLLADDDSFHREALREVLEALEFKVVGEASDGIQAIIEAIQTDPDVVLMDLRRRGGVLLPPEGLLRPTDLPRGPEVARVQPVLRDRLQPGRTPRGITPRPNGGPPAARARWPRWPPQPRPRR